MRESNLYFKAFKNLTLLGDDSQNALGALSNLN